MKRFISLFLVLVLVFSFAACSGEDETKKDEKYGVDIAYYLGTGKFDTAEFALGTPTTEIDKVMKQHEETHAGGDGHDDGIFFYEGIYYSSYDSADFGYYYNNDKKTKGISYIVASNEFYGFAVGETGKYTVKNVLEGFNFEVKESVAEENDFFHLPVSMSDCKKLSVENGNNILEFYFENDVLIFAAIWNKNNWTF